MTGQRTFFNPTIHGARGLFAMMVFLYHVAHSGLQSFAFVEGSAFDLYFLNSLKFGVELFFGISGYVIVGALARAPTLRAFLWDRATRIFPLLWVTLTAIILFAKVTQRWLPPLGDLLLNFAAPPPFFPLPQINPAAWSLGYELTFYALCAGCWALRARIGRSWIPIALLIGAALLAFFPRAILMPAGVLIASGLLDRPAVRRVVILPGLALLLFLLGWRAIDLAYGGDIMTFSPAMAPLGPWAATLPFALATGLMGAFALLGIAQQRGPFCRLLRTLPLQWLGTISYSFYLWHPVVMGFVKLVLQKSGAFAAVGPGAQLLFAAVSLPPALLIAHYSQLWIERRLTRFLRKLGPGGRNAKAPLTASIEPGTSLTAPAP